MGAFESISKAVCWMVGLDTLQVLDFFISLSVLAKAILHMRIQIEFS